MEFDEKTSQDLHRWLRKIGVYLGTFVAGGIVTFAYSYHALHDAKNWTIDNLEEQVETRVLRLNEVERELVTLKRRASGQPDASSFKELQQDLEKATTKHAQLEKKLDRAVREARDLEKSRNSWKAKYVKADRSRGELEAELAIANTVTPGTGAPDSAELNDWRLAAGGGIDDEQRLANSDAGSTMAGDAVLPGQPATDTAAEAGGSAASPSTFSVPASPAGTP